MTKKSMSEGVAKVVSTKKFECEETKVKTNSKGFQEMSFECTDTKYKLTEMDFGLYKFQQTKVKDYMTMSKKSATYHTKKTNEVDASFKRQCSAITKLLGLKLETEVK